MNGGGQKRCRVWACLSLEAAPDNAHGLCRWHEQLFQHFREQAAGRRKLPALDHELDDAAWKRFRESYDCG